MNLKKFQETISKQGIARTNRWVTRITPPAGLTSTGRALSNILSTGGNRLNINLPGLDALDAGVEALNDLNVDILDGVNIEHNFSIPTLGYALTNMGDKLEALNLFCAGCQIPGRDLENIQFKEYGEFRSLGVNHTHADFTITYYCSEDLRERLFFEQWQDLIFNPITKEHAYYKDYTSTVEVIKYDTSWHNRTASYKLHECYPTNIAAQELTSGDQALLELQVAFKYRNYERTL